MPGFQEVGRAIRTAFLLRYLSDLNLRRQITATTNKAESYNTFSDWLFFGGEGLLAENDPEDEGYEIWREHLAQLSSYLTGHIKRFGDYVEGLESVPEPLDVDIPALKD